MKKDTRKSTQQIREQVDSWIAEEELPINARLKRESKWDCLFDFENEEEKEAYYDFVHWYMNQHWALAMSIPIKSGCDWSPETHMAYEDYLQSAFNTADYQRLHPRYFNTKQYAVKKCLERVYDLAQTHSCVSNEVSKGSVRRKFIEEVKVSFTEWAEIFKKLYLTHPKHHNARTLLRIQEINEHIKEAKEIWEREAYAT